MPDRFLAIDLGASSGRLMMGEWNGETFALNELHRFANVGVMANGRLEWKMQRIWSELKTGLRKFAVEYGESPRAIGVDAWGVDFGLLDSAGELLGNPVHYRDTRTQGVPERVFPLISEYDLFRATGVQSLPINTLYQLRSMVESGDVELQRAQTLLMIPDLVNYLLCGETAAEWTEATTSQMTSVFDGSWANGVTSVLGIPDRLLPPIVLPGTVLGSTLPVLTRDCGLGRPAVVVAVGCHDTASAVAAIPNMDSQSIFLSSGTWSLMGVEADAPDISRAVFELGFTNEGGVGGKTLLMKNLTGLWILQECFREWSASGETTGWDDVVRASSRAPALRSVFDATDPRLVAPYSMLRTVRECCREGGQPVPETKGEVARAVMESLCLAYRSTVVSLETLTGRQLPVIRLVGGGAQNSLLSQMIADACERPVVAGPIEASALGNVLMQAIALGEVHNIASAREAVAASVQCVQYEPSNTGSAWQRAHAHLNQLAKTA